MAIYYFNISQSTFIISRLCYFRKDILCRKESETTNNYQIISQLDGHLHFRHFRLLNFIILCLRLLFPEKCPSREESNRYYFLEMTCPRHRIWGAARAWGGKRRRKWRGRKWSRKCPALLRCARGWYRRACMRTAERWTSQVRARAERDGPNSDNYFTTQLLFFISIFRNWPSSFRAYVIFCKNILY